MRTGIQHPTCRGSLPVEGLLEAADRLWPPRPRQLLGSLFAAALPASASAAGLVAHTALRLCPDVCSCGP